MLRSCDMYFDLLSMLQVGHQEVNKEKIQGICDKVIVLLKYEEEIQLSQIY